MDTIDSHTIRDLLANANDAQNPHPDLLNLNLMDELDRDEDEDEDDGIIEGVVDLDQYEYPNANG